jgi:hypothetical protein
MESGRKKELRFSQACKTVAQVAKRAAVLDSPKPVVS